MHDLITLTDESQCGLPLIHDLLPTALLLHHPHEGGLYTVLTLKLPATTCSIINFLITLPNDRGQQISGKRQSDHIHSFQVRMTETREGRFSEEFASLSAPPLNVTCQSSLYPSLGKENYYESRIFSFQKHENTKEDRKMGGLVSCPAQTAQIPISVLGHISTSPFGAAMPVNGCLQPTCDPAAAGRTL